MYLNHVSIEADVHEPNLESGFIPTTLSFLLKRSSTLCGSHGWYPFDGVENLEGIICMICVNQILCKPDLLNHIIYLRIMRSFSGTFVCRILYNFLEVCKKKKSRLQALRKFIHSLYISYNLLQSSHKSQF